jgi:hypothetical protein
VAKNMNVDLKIQPLTNAQLRMLKLVSSLNKQDMFFVGISFILKISIYNKK